MSQLWDMYQQFGKENFTKMVVSAAPYFRTIDPQFAELEPRAKAVVEVPFRVEVTNHVGSFHAIALCNAAELAAGTLTNISVPPGARWIPTGMRVEYLAKAKSDVVAIADGSDVDWNSTGNLEVPVSISDDEGKEVFTAVIIMNVRHA